jgi:hypothetical protein
MSIPALFLSLLLIPRFQIYSGEVPFPELRNGIAANLAIVDGTRPPRPPTMPDIVWEIANGCWRSDPNCRPSILSVII